MVVALLPALVTLLAQQSPSPGKIAENVRCAQDATQGYALYLPSNYTPDRPWPLLLAFDPRARGMNAVERFAPAAEKYGWIIVGSNNSRNGDGQSSVSSLRAMTGDLFSRYAIDGKRIYTGGMSGGARIAMQFALTTDAVAGVIAASAAYPDGKVRKSVPFPVFGTAGTDDFNWREMRELDQTLTSPHRVTVFEGGHVWLSADLATEAVEWLELQAMKSGTRKKDPQIIDRLFADRVAKAEALQGKPAWQALRNIGQDFDGLRNDASAFAARAKKMEREKPVQDALKRERNEADRERQLTEDLFRAEGELTTDKRPDALLTLRDRLADLSKQASAETDSSERRIARRVTRNIAASGAGGKRDPEFQKILEKLGLTGRPR